MDELVRQAMAKWPNVPDCYGWLGLDSRGQWRMRDDRIQALGHFQSGDPAAKGAILHHEKLIEFIQRNYEADVNGRWYFQNGPQRVYVELEATPLIWRVGPDASVIAHTGQSAKAQTCLVDEEGLVYVHADLGLGLVHSLDVLQAADCIEKGLWRVQQCTRQDLPTRYGYVMSPQRT